MSGESKEEIKTSFQRRRRNLLFICTVAIFGLWSGIEIPETVTVFGTGVKVQRPEVIFYGFWIVLAYWAVRYYQLYKDIGNKGFNDAKYSRFKVLSKRLATKVINLNEIPIDKQFGHRRLGDVGIANVTAVAGTNLLDDGLHLNVSGTVTYYRNHKIVGVTDIGMSTVIASKADFRRTQFWAWLYVITSTRLATEYILPYVLFGITVTWGLITLMSNI